MFTAKEIIESITEENTGTGYSNKAIIKAMKSYARQACKAQKEICGDTAYQYYNFAGMSELADIIRNAPLPTLK